MKALLGYDAGALKEHKKSPILWDYDRVINPHISISGLSGVGKSHTIRHIMEQLSQSTRPGQRVRFHVYDTQGDMEIPGASSLLFSEQTNYGLNPLRINPDPHFGGVRKRVLSFINALNRISTLRLGVKQEACLRNILFDVYSMAGFDGNDPKTWFIDESETQLVSDGSDGRLYIDVPREAFETVSALGVAQWDPVKRLFWVSSDLYRGPITRWPLKTAGRGHPTLRDVYNYTQRLIDQAFLGSDQAAVSALEAHNRASSSYQRKVIDAARRGNADWQDETIESALEQSAEKAISAFTNYVNSIKTGRELANLLKYDSVDTLKQVAGRLEGMLHAGIFKDMPMPFAPRASVWHYNISPLRTVEQVMFTFFRMEELFDLALQRGIQDDVVDYHVIDEYGLFATAAEDPEAIPNRIAKTGRKFGTGLICAAQDPTVYSDDLISTIGTKILLTVDESHWRGLQSKMMIEQRQLAWLQPWKTMAVSMKLKGSTRSDWLWAVQPGAVPGG